MRENLHALPRAPGRRASERTGRGRKILLWAAVLAALWLVAVSRVYVNASWSDGAWGYLVLPLPGAPERGDAVLFDPPEETGSAIPYLKTVRGLPGDRVEVDRERRVSVNGAVLGTAKTHALDGRRLEAIGPGVIPPGRYYVHADHVDSHDSRYSEIGLIPQERIRGGPGPCPTFPGSGSRDRSQNPRRRGHDAASSPATLPAGHHLLRDDARVAACTRKGPRRARHGVEGRRARPARTDRGPAWSA